ncbi:MAG: Unknown protein [uncultured Sulfurovum sp.]|uniref:Uncharacterized protein n=1 Tax=uncultured Sulfurovum sp. TaxID=269237 RepID=A0A6S6T8U1_9BACT|nr:MAG: Unknown protein [uncultured Sulfurovum sp.]
MDIKVNKKLLNEAINSGCKTAAELALYIKRHSNMQTMHITSL